MQSGQDTRACSTGVGIPYDRADKNAHFAHQSHIRTGFHVIEFVKCMRKTSTIVTGEHDQSLELKKKNHVSCEVFHPDVSSLSFCKQ